MNAFRAIRVFLFLALMLQAMLPFSRSYAQDTALVHKLLSRGLELHESRPDSAMVFYRAVIDDFEKNADSLDLHDPDIVLKTYLSSVIRAINQSGNIHYYRDEYNQAGFYFRQSLQLAEKAKLNPNAARALFDIGYVEYKKSNYMQALDLFENAACIYEKLGDSLGRYHVLNACGLTFNRLRDFSGADSCFWGALQLAQMMKDNFKMADIKIHLGILNCEQEQLHEGIRLFEEALDYYESFGDQEAISDALLNIGVVLKMVGAYEKAHSYLQRSLKIEETEHIKSRLVIRYFHLADNYLRKNAPEKAMKYAQKTLILAEDIASGSFQAEGHYLMGKYHFNEGQYNMALTHFREALQNAEKPGKQLLLAESLLWYAKSLEKLDRLDEALNYARKSFDQAFLQESNSLRKETAFLLYALYKTKGNNDEALRWYEVYHRASDSLNYLEQQKEIRKIEAAFLNERKERENLLLKNKTMIQEQKLKNRSITMIALGLAILLSIVAIVLLVYRMKYAASRNREQRLQSLQKLRELNEELDGKKRELASKVVFLNQKNELIGRIMEQLKELQQSDANSHQEISALVNELRTDIPQSNWKEFETQFVQVHPDFYKRLHQKHPGMTSYEQRLCAFLRMNLNTREIASITGRSVKSIEVTRSRIRKKLGLSRNENLSAYLASI